MSWLVFILTALTLMVIGCVVADLLPEKLIKKLMKHF